MNIPLFPLPNLLQGSAGTIEKIMKCILQDQDLKTAKRLFQKNKDKPDFVKDFTEKLRSDYISAESLCSMVLFLNKFPEINFQISEKALKNCCSYYNNLSSLDETVILKNKDFINRLFPLFAEKNAFYWIMAFDCIYQNMRSTRHYKLQTTNKYLKSLNLRQFIQLFVKCLENIQYEKNYGTSNNFSFSASTTSSAACFSEKGVDGDGGDSFQQDIENTSIQIKHKQQIQSLQIFAQRLVLHVHHLKLETKFWQVLRVIFENEKNNNNNLPQKLIQAGLPWLISKKGEGEEDLDLILKETTTVLSNSLATEMILPFEKKSFVYFPKHLIKKNKNKTRLYLPFLKSYSLETILCNEELFFQLESKKFTSDELVNAIQASDPEKLLKEKLIDFFQTNKLSLDPKIWNEKKMFLFFETNLYLILQDKCIPVEYIFKWTETTGHVNLDPRFLAKINDGNLPEKFYKIQRLVNP